MTGGIQLCLSLSFDPFYAFHYVRTQCFSLQRTHNKEPSCKQKSTLTKILNLQCLHHGLPASRTMGNKFLLFINYPRYFVMTAQMDQYRCHLTFSALSIFYNLRTCHNSCIQMWLKFWLDDYSFLAWSIVSILIVRYGLFSSFSCR